ncbi:MAG: GspH/FimT family pseudopilin [Nitrospirae bacterium]|nr:GspH/FimT family pseudopilin [Nitrospirota bacterium]
MKSERGVTLIEMMVVLAIIAIVSAVSVLNSQGLLNSYRVRAAARQVFSDVQTARLGAIKGGRAWALCFPAGNPVAVTTYTLRNVAGADTALCTADDGPPVRTTTIGNPRLVITKNFAAAALSFNPNGTASTGGNLVTIASSDGARTVTINITTGTGNPRIQ